MKKLIQWAVGIATAVLCVIAWVKLPEMVAVQTGAGIMLSNSLPKPAAILLPVALAVFGVKGIGAEDKQAVRRSLVLAVLGPVLLGVLLIINL